MVGDSWPDADYLGFTFVYQPKITINFIELINKKFLNHKFGRGL